MSQLRSILKSPAPSVHPLGMPSLCCPPSATRIVESTLVHHNTKSITFDDLPVTLFYYLDGYDPIAASRDKELMTKRELRDNQIKYTVPVVNRDGPFNYKYALVRIINSSRDTHLKWKVSIMPAIYLQNGCLYTDDIPTEWRRFYQLLLEWSRGVVEEVNDPVRVLTDRPYIVEENMDAFDIANKKNDEHHDYWLLTRDRIHHSHISYARAVIWSTGHFVGRDGFFDDIIARAEMFQSQLSWYMNHILSIG